jgi:hypothetical protein
MIKFRKEQIIQFTYDRQIVEEDGNIHGFVNFNGKNELKIWLKIGDNQYTDDDDKYDDWIASRNGITVNELRSQRLKEREKVYGYLKQKKKKTKNKKESLIKKIKQGHKSNNNEKE